MNPVQPPHTVLLVDDEPEILASLGRTLRREPYRLLTTTSPIDAFNQIGPNGVDLIVADIDMPELNGLELIARIRRDHPQVVRILLTGDASVDSALAAINQGEVHRYLTKPWQTKELRSTIREALTRVDEFRAQAVIAEGATAQQRRCAELEERYPSIGTVVFDDDGAYLLDIERAAAVLESVNSQTLRDLCAIGGSITDTVPCGSRRADERHRHQHVEPGRRDL